MSESSSNELAGEMMDLLKPPMPYGDREADSQVAKFYTNRTVFITGATGFIGKALIEKLVRSCPGIKKIYILVREKKGKTIEERLDDLIKSENFNKIRATSEKELRSKIWPIQGDITMPKFGIQAEDMSLLSRECSIVFNSAATIRFMEPIDVAVRNNIYSVGQLVDFCDCLENLEALVHLSTAYSNCHKKDTIYEIFYEPPMGGDQVQQSIERIKEIQDKIHVYPSNKNTAKKDSQSRSACELQTFYDDNFTFEASGSLSKANGSSPSGQQPPAPSGPPAGYDLLEEFSRIALRKSNRPNTYTFTKAISENYLLDKVRARPDRYLNDKIPVAIVRPSIVGGCWREPIVGHVDNYNGPTGAMMSLYTGALQAMPGRGNMVADLVPVDMVTNMVLCTGWFLASGATNKSNVSATQSIKGDQGAFIFNMVSGYRNPLRWHQVTDKIAELAYKYPSKYLVRLPSSYFLEAGKKYELYDKINQKLPAMVADFIKGKILRQELTNRTSSMASYRRVKQVGDTLSPFTSNQWHLSDANTKALYDNYLNESDRRLFHFDVKAIDWTEYLRNYIIGSRVYTLRDDPNNIPSAMRQLKRRQMANGISLSILFMVFYFFILHQSQLETFVLDAIGI